MGGQTPSTRASPFSPSKPSNYRISSTVPSDFTRRTSAVPSTASSALNLLSVSLSVRFVPPVSDDAVTSV